MLGVGRYVKFTAQDRIWVTELWLDHASLDVSLERLRTSEGEAEVATR